MTLRRRVLIRDLQKAINDNDTVVATRLMRQMAEVDNPAVKSTFAGGGIGAAIAYFLATTWGTFAVAPAEVQVLIGSLIAGVVGGVAGPLYRKLVAWAEDV